MKQQCDHWARGGCRGLKQQDQDNYVISSCVCFFSWNEIKWNKI